eukprot:170740-Pyramimonas_sp.AAC.1
MLRSTPFSVLGLDVLHAVHLGVAQRLGSVIFWRVVEANVARKRSIAQRVKHMESELHARYELQKIPQEARLGRLTPGMIGGTL